MASILQVGLGPLGRRLVEFALERGHEIVAAVDMEPGMAGASLASLCPTAPHGVHVSGAISEALASAARPDVALVATVSSLEALEPQVTELAGAGVPVVSTCEELFYPWNTKPRVAARIDQAFRAGGAACLGTGVNPGFLMDYLPSVLTGCCRTVETVEVWRVQDAAPRRVPFQRKIGAGLSADAFRAREAQGTLRHVGLAESLDFIAARLGWTLERRSETLEPVIAREDVFTGYTPIRRGMARGVEQVARGFANGRERITLTFRAAVGEPEPYDRVRIAGDPEIDSTIRGGVHGDTASCAIMVNAVASVLASPPGLRTMADVPLVACATVRG